MRNKLLTWNGLTKLFQHSQHQIFNDITLVRGNKAKNFQHICYSLYKILQCTAKSSRFKLNNKNLLVNIGLEFVRKKVLQVASVCIKKISK